MSLVKFIPIWAVALVVVRWLAESWLAAINRRHVQAQASEVPVAFRETMDAATYSRSVAYTLAKSRFGQLEEAWGTLVLLAALLAGGLPASLEAFRSHWGTTAWIDAAWLFAVGLVLSIPGLPFDWWGQFRLEARFGFNTTTRKID